MRVCGNQPSQSVSHDGGRSGARPWCRGGLPAATAHYQPAATRACTPTDAPTGQRSSLKTAPTSSLPPAAAASGAHSALLLAATAHPHIHTHTPDCCAAAAAAGCCASVRALLAHPVGHLFCLCCCHLQASKQAHAHAAARNSVCWGHIRAGTKRSGTTRAQPQLPVEELGATHLAAAAAPPVVTLVARNPELIHPVCMQVAVAPRRCCQHPASHHACVHVRVHARTHTRTPTTHLYRRPQPGQGSPSPSRQASSSSESPYSSCASQQSIALHRGACDHSSPRNACAGRRRCCCLSCSACRPRQAARGGCGHAHALPQQHTTTGQTRSSRSPLAAAAAARRGAGVGGWPARSWPCLTPPHSTWAGC
jgi:hypothetical protein